MKSEKTNIVERSFKYSLRIIKFYRELEKDSIGANVHEAQGAQSKADFIAKMFIAHKEAYESAYWIRLVKEANLISADRLNDLSDETKQIIKILSSILLTSKQGIKK